MLWRRRRRQSAVVRTYNTDNESCPLPSFNVSELTDATLAAIRSVHAHEHINGTTRRLCGCIERPRGKLSVCPTHEAMHRAS